MLINGKYFPRRFIITAAIKPTIYLVSFFHLLRTQPLKTTKIFKPALRLYLSLSLRGSQTTLLFLAITLIERFENLRLWRCYGQANFTLCKFCVTVIHIKVYLYIYYTFIYKIVHLYILIYIVHLYIHLYIHLPYFYYSYIVGKEYQATPLIVRKEQ